MSSPLRTMLVLAFAAGALAGTAFASDDTATTDTATTEPSEPSTDTAPVDNDGDGVDSTTDCDDADPNVLGPAVRYHDRDGDGFGATPADACPSELAFVDDATDCDDTDALVNPAATELCNGLDDNCDGLTDGADAADPVTWHIDADGDHHGDAAFPLTACDRPDGYVSGDTDCDDTDATINPAAPELCDDIDNNCDGLTDDPESTGTSTWYADADGDSYGDATRTTEACSQPDGYVTDATDCDDVHATVGPPVLLYRDHDGDEYGDPRMAEYACPQVIDHVADNTDCDDYDASVYPGAPDPAGDGVDQDCDGLGEDTGSPVDTSDTGDTSDTSIDTDTSDTFNDDTGMNGNSASCGCHSGPMSSWAVGLPGLAVVLIRVRRRRACRATR